MTSKRCDRILDGLVVNEQGELVLDESFREHLDECAQCREVHEQIEAAEEERAPNYVPAVMRRIRESRTEILEALVVDEKGELGLHEGFREHLYECSRCREIHERIEAAKEERVPNYVPAVMRRIREMEAARASVKWWERLRELFTIPVIMRPRILVPAGAVIVVAMMLLVLSILSPPPPPLPPIPETIANIAVEIGDVERQMSTKLDVLISKQARLFESDLQNT